MGYTNTTPNYSLPQYVADDRPSYLGDWNEAMGKIDTGMQQNKSDVTDVDTKVVNLTERVGNIETDVEQVQQDVGKANSAASAAQAAVGELAGSVYTKAQADSRFMPRYGGDDSAVLVCIGDSILSGWSDENPNSIAAWDTYLGSALGFASGNIFKAATGGAGFATGTTFTSEVDQAKTAVTTAGKNLSDVKLVVIGGGVNDVRNEITAENVRQGAMNAVNAAGAAFPNAMIHVFPGIIGNKGLSSALLAMEAAVCKGVSEATMYARRATAHTGAWSWNYDGNDDGVSADHIHLLAGGLAVVGKAMALEINGGSAYRESYSTKYTDANGAEKGVLYRRGTMAAFNCASNFTSISSSSTNAAIGVDARYGNDGYCIFFTTPAQNDTVIMFYHEDLGWFASYQELSNTGVYGSVCFPIESTF